VERKASFPVLAYVGTWSSCVGRDSGGGAPLSPEIAGRGTGRGIVLRRIRDVPLDTSGILSGREFSEVEVRPVVSLLIVWV
jgi:hypothetical protein